MNLQAEMAEKRKPWVSRGQSGTIHAKKEKALDSMLLLSSAKDVCFDLVDLNH